MDNHINFLITQTDGKSLFRTAVRITADKLSPEKVWYWAEPENQEALLNILPTYVQSLGAIVKVEEIFTVLNLGNN